MPEKIINKLIALLPVPGALLAFLTFVTLLGGILAKLLATHIPMGILSEALNLVMLLIFFFILCSERHHFAHPIASLEFQTQANALVKEIRTNLLLFIALLIFFYLITLLNDIFQFFTKSPAFPFWIFNGLTVSLNTASATHIYFIYGTLYKTRKGNLSGTSNNYPGPFLLLMIALTACWLLLGHNPDPNGSTTTLLKLGCGLYNCFVIILLYGRLIAFDTVWLNGQITGPATAKEIHTWHLNYIIYIVPCLALAQTMYVFLDSSQLTPQQDWIRFLVFSFCLVGKAFLLLHVRKQISSGALHSYFATLASNLKLHP